MHTQPETSNPGKIWYRKDLIPASIYDKHSVCPSFGPSCTRCWFTMTNIIRVCSKLHRAQLFIRNTRPNEVHEPSTLIPKLSTPERVCIKKISSGRVLFDKYPGSTKIATHLDHISHCKPRSGTTWSNTWTYRIFIINTRRDKIETVAHKLKVL